MSPMWKRELVPLCRGTCRTFIQFSRLVMSDSLRPHEPTGCPALISLYISLEADITPLDEVTFEEGQPGKEGKKLDSC